jgi:hypothetical protein
MGANHYFPESGRHDSAVAEEIVRYNFKRYRVFDRVNQRILTRPGAK